MAAPSNKDNVRIDLRREILDNSGIKPVISAILGNDEATVRWVTESLFVSHVIPLLRRIWDRDNQTHYTKYVGELTRPLNVVADDNKANILFQIPALIQRPSTTMADPSKGGPDISAADVIHGMERYRALNMQTVADQKILDYIQDVTFTQNIADTVIKPIINKLYDYGFQMDFTVAGAPAGDNTPTPNKVEAPSQVAGTVREEDEYLDED